MPCMHLPGHGEWPRYSYVDKMLDRGSLDVREVLPTLPPSLRPDPARPIAAYIARALWRQIV
jgi:hypothetical protein